MQLPEILFSDATGYPGSGILISSRNPFNVGKVIKHDNNQKMDAFLGKWNLHNRCGVIPGYNILIYWIGTLDHIFEITPSGESVPDTVLPELNKMAAYYETEHVKKTQKDLKDISGSKKKKPNGTGHGGARAGSGRDFKEYKSKIAGFNLPIILLEGIEQAGIGNKTAYVSYLIAKDLMQKVTDESAKKEFKEMAAVMKKGIFKGDN